MGVVKPVEHLADLDVVTSRPVGGGPRVDIVDRRLRVELVSLDPREAAQLGGLLVARSARAGWVAGHDPGE